MCLRNTELKHSSEKRRARRKESCLLWSQAFGDHQRLPCGEYNDTGNICQYLLYEKVWVLFFWFSTLTWDFGEDCSSLSSLLRVKALTVELDGVENSEQLTLEAEHEELVFGKVGWRAMRKQIHGWGIFRWLQSWPHGLKLGDGGDWRSHPKSLPFCANFMDYNICLVHSLSLIVEHITLKLSSNNL